MNAPALLRRAGTDRTGRPFLIRPTTSEDAEALVALRDAVALEGDGSAVRAGERSVLEERLAIAGLHALGGLALTVEVEGAVAGQLSVLRLRPPWQAHVGELSIAIAAEHRDRGLGSELLKVAGEWAEVVGIRRLTLSVLIDNARAIAAYRRAGYVVEGTQRRHLHVAGIDRDLVLMALAVSPRGASGGEGSTDHP